MRHIRVRSLIGRDKGIEFDMREDAAQNALASGSVELVAEAKVPLPNAEVPAAVPAPAVRVPAEPSVDAKVLPKVSRKGAGSMSKSKKKKGK